MTNQIAIKAESSKMPKLYTEEYTKTLAGTKVVIACRESVLMKNFSQIVNDINFLRRQGIRATLFYDFPNRFTSREKLRLLKNTLEDAAVEQISPGRDQGYYEWVLNAAGRAEKIIFLERRYLSDEKGRKLNSLTTRSARRLSKERKIIAFGDLAANANFQKIIEKVCVKIESGEVNRIHIVAGGKHCLKHELFSLEGVGTLIANNFVETLDRVQTDQEVRIIQDILKPYIKQGLIKRRRRDYISSRRDNFYTAKIDGIPVGCVEMIVLDSFTAELGALAVATRYRNQQIGFFLIRSFVEMAKKDGFLRVVSLTKNQKLKNIYLSVGFRQKSPEDLRFRQAKSPDAPMFVRSIY